MKFPAKFTRYKTVVPPGGKVLGTDTVPTVAPNPSIVDNLLQSRFNNINGYPIHRVGVTYKGPVGAVNLSATMWFWEENSLAWYQIGDAQDLIPNRVVFFDVVALLDMPNTQQDLGSATSGSVAQLIIVEDDVGAPAGEYVFTLGPDLTTQS